MAGYCVMRWTNDGDRLSTHHMKHIIEPKKPYSSYQVGDVGLATYPGYPGQWAFIILAIGEKRAEMEQWLSDYLKEVDEIQKATKSLKPTSISNRKRSLFVVDDTGTDESPHKTHRGKAPLVSHKDRPHRDKSPPLDRDQSHHVSRMDKSSDDTQRDKSPPHITLADFCTVRPATLEPSADEPPTASPKTTGNKTTTTTPKKSAATPKKFANKTTMATPKKLANKSPKATPKKSVNKTPTASPKPATLEPSADEPPTASPKTTGNKTTTTPKKSAATPKKFANKTTMATPKKSVNKTPNDYPKAPGICIQYNGTVCKSVLRSSTVYLNLTGTNPLAHHERMAAELLQEFEDVDTTDAMMDRCNGNAEKLICNYIFPPCEDYINPKPIPLCRESCVAVQDLLCYVQWPIVQGANIEAKLPDCDSKQLVSKRNKNRMCTEANMFAHEETEVTSDCYVEKGRWYNGTMNITLSGKPCQHWHLNEPQAHKRPPEVYKELENSENYCRNPGAEEDGPWCYIAIDKPGYRWERCEVPQCSTKKTFVVQPTMSWPTILIITVVSSCGVFIVALVGVLIFIFISRRRNDIQYKNTPQDDLEIDIQKLPANMSYHCVEEPVRLNPKLQAYEYPRNDVIYVKDIGQGAFGRVFKARAPNLTKDSDNTLVAVKMLKDDASDDLQADFEREASLMAEFNHPNIVKFLGVCAIGKPMCLLFEYMTKGDLNDYLRISSPDQYIVRKHNSDIQHHEISSIDTIDQLDIAHQVAAGMVYLSDKCYVHRDLATRNCLITDNLTVKISDFGLARSVHRLEYYKGSDNDAIPIRWMPLESILYNKFSVESDVWSFGVILWEIFSFALQPYYGMTHEEVVEYLKEGKNLVCPENTPSQMYDLMVKCWNRKPSSRPKFHFLHSTLVSLFEEISKKRMKETSMV